MWQIYTKHTITKRTYLKSQDKIYDPKKRKIIFAALVKERIKEYGQATLVYGGCLGVRSRRKT